MRIERRNDARTDAERLRNELKEILTSGTDGRPVCGPSCQHPEPRNCSRNCPEIPRALSTDPENHPIETRIVPLAFELKRLEVFHPCWSCEGHNRADGSLWKMPRVWFYCQSVVHVRVLAESLKQLHMDGKLNALWHVVITYSANDNSDTTFSLEPQLNGAAPAPLAKLQKDIDTIAEFLHDRMFDEARRLSRMVK